MKMAAEIRMMNDFEGRWSIVLRKLNSDDLLTITFTINVDFIKKYMETLVFQSDHNSLDVHHLSSSEKQCCLLPPSFEPKHKHYRRSRYK